MTKIVMLAALVMVVATVSFIIGAIAAAEALTNDDDYLDKMPERKDDEKEQENFRGRPAGGMGQNTRKLCKIQEGARKENE